MYLYIRQVDVIHICVQLNLWLRALDYNPHLELFFNEMWDEFSFINGVLLLNGDQDPMRPSLMVIDIQQHIW